MAAKHRLGVLLSGRGSNFVALHGAIARGEVPGAEIAVVLSNKADAAGLAAARELGLAARAIPQQGKGAEARVAQDRAMLAALREHGVEVVCLAGYMRLISAEFVAAYRDRILNIHPSLLPAFPGLDAQRQALETGVEMTGCTVHLVDELMDHGRILLQRAVPVLAGDTVETLATRVLVEEHLAYPEALRAFLAELDFGS